MNLKGTIAQNIFCHHLLSIRLPKPMDYFPLWKHKRRYFEEEEEEKKEIQV